MPRVVVMRDHGPLVIKKTEMEDDVVTVCRCGLSAGWPYCDGTHNKTKKEEPNTILQYTRREKDDPIKSAPSSIDASKADPRPWTREAAEAESSRK